MTDDDKYKGWDGRGAHTPSKGLTYQEALDEEMKRRKEWAERDRAMAEADRAERARWMAKLKAMRDAAEEP